MNTKKCAKCKTVKSVECFGSNASRFDGYQVYCKACRIAYYTAHRTEIAAQRKLHYSSELAVQRVKKWQKKNPNKVKEYGRRQRQNPTHVAQQRQAAKIWRATHRDLRQLQKVRRRARKRNLPDAFSQNDWKRALDYFHGACAYCGHGPSLFDLHPVLHADHYIPLAANNCPGTVPTNIVPACQSCNLSKASKAPCDWLAERFDVKRAKAIQDGVAAYFEWVKTQT